MNLQSLLSGKKKKNIINLSSAVSAQRMVNVSIMTSGPGSEVIKLFSSSAEYEFVLLINLKLLTIAFFFLVKYS